MPIDNLRKEYLLGELDETTAPEDPVVFFERWFEEAKSQGLIEPNAMALATATAAGVPSLRMVLLKGVDERGFVFFTNRQSRKGRELESNPEAALLFYWDKLERQVRVSGEVVRTEELESEEYFSRRPKRSQIAAFMSPQSEEIPDRGWLESEYSRAEASIGEAAVQRPAHWGGYRLVPREFEFWQGRENRLHDRVVYRRVGDGWRRARLAP